MPILVGYLLLFVAIAVFFVFIHLMIGKLIRPIKPDAEKLTIYECGEPTVGSAWIQFDVRFYVIALLFVIFDVEVAFFFPWALVFGKTTDLARKDLPDPQREALMAQLAPGQTEYTKQVIENKGEPGPAAAEFDRWQRGARRFSLIAFIDILVFFGVLLVGYAYLWRRGDLEWVRSMAAEQTPTERAAELSPAEASELIGAGHGS
jgi:NADH-quinone oxidoreductase subunit A